MSRRICRVKGTNSKGVQFALVEDIDGSFMVIKRCPNYDGKVPGGIRYTWRWVQRDMSRADADALFTRRVEK